MVSFFDVTNRLLVAKNNLFADCNAPGHMHSDREGVCLLGIHELAVVSDLGRCFQMLFLQDVFLLITSS